MTSTTRNALYVLRLVWQSQSSPILRRGASTATASLARESNNTTSTSAAPSTIDIPHHHRYYAESSNHSFLESESDEYEAASSLLPARQLEPEPIPWPTLFRHSNTVTPKSKFCEPIYRLVSQGRYEEAMKIYQEILSHNLKVRQGLLDGNSIRIQHRHEYLKPVLGLLEKGDHKAVLLWLNIYPNRPATFNHPTIKKVWEPIINFFIDDSMRNRHFYKEDPIFLQEFLMLIGKKGLLPTLLPPLLPHLTFASTPQDSKMILEQTIHEYWIYTTSNGFSDTERAKFQEEFVSKQIPRWWGSYLRKLIIAGWKDEARSLVGNKPFQGEWDEITQKFIKEELASGQSEASVEGDVEGAEPVALRLTDIPTITKQIRSCLNDLPTPTDLATLIRALSHPFIAEEHPTLLNRFKSRFIHPPSRPRGRNYPSIQEKLWLHAEIINLQKEGDHQGAVQLFDENFIWTGLPDRKTVFTESSISTSSDENVNRLKSYLTIQIITTLIPSLIAILPHPRSKSIRPFYTSYLDHINSFPPSLKPNSVTHATLLREIVHHSNPRAGEHVLRNLVEMGYQPGESSYAAILYAFAGRRETNQVWNLLAEAERENMVSRRTYRGLIAILVKTGLAKDAERMFWRARERLEQEDILDGLKV